MLLKKIVSASCGWRKGGLKNKEMKFIKLNLKFGSLDCILEFDDLRWHGFFKKKYSNFFVSKDIVKKEGKCLSFQFIISAQRKELRWYFDGEKFKGKVFAPDNLRYFNLINNILKKSYGLFILSKKGILLHASSVRFRNKAYLFSGPRDSGKSTVIKFLPEFKPLSEDTAIIKKLPEGFYLFTPPFDRKNNFIGENIKTPLGKIFILEPFLENYLEEIRNKEEKLAIILKNTLVEWRQKMNVNNSLFKSLLQTCYDVTCEVPIYKLRFKKDSSFIDIIT